MKESRQRKINYLRISITENCNLKYRYCVEDSFKEGTVDAMGAAEICALIESTVKLGISKVRFTGGEPLLYKDIYKIIEETKKLESIKEICITSNGLLLEKMAENLKKCGLNRVNIVLDTLDPKRYEKMTEAGNLDRVLRGIEKCQRLGIKVSINATIIEGWNEEDILKFSEWTLKENIKVRFIEPIKGELLPEIKALSEKEIRRIIENRYKILREEGSYSSTAKYWKIEGSLGKIGFIDSTDHKFCSECNRIRVTAQGEIKKCMYSKSNLNIIEFIRKGISQETIEAFLRAEIYNNTTRF